MIYNWSKDFYMHFIGDKNFKDKIQGKAKENERENKKKNEVFVKMHQGNL